MLVRKQFTSWNRSYSIIQQATHIGAGWVSAQAWLTPAYKSRKRTGRERGWGSSGSPGGVFFGDGLEDFLRSLLAQLLGGLQDALWGEQVGWDGRESRGLWWGRVCVYSRGTSNTAAITDRSKEGTNMMGTTMSFKKSKPMLVQCTCYSSASQTVGCPLVGNRGIAGGHVMLY